MTCECGCGEEVRPGLRFVRFHHRRVDPRGAAGRARLAAGPVFCECGCGTQLSDRAVRLGCRFKHGHNRFGDKPFEALAAARRAKWPTKEQIEALLAQHGTLSAVAVILGRQHPNFRYICDQLGVEWQPHSRVMEDCPSGFGWSGEEHAALLLRGEVVRTPANREPYDVRWRGLRVEVKTARPSASGRDLDQWGWSFNVRHNRGKNDVYFLICCADNGLPAAYLLVPSEHVTQTLIRFPVTMRGKWARFLWRPGGP